MTEKQFRVLRYLKSYRFINQRALVKALKMSLGSVNKAINELKSMNYIDNQFQVTELGLLALHPYKVSNAIILAAGFGSRFVPFTYEMPKGLIKVHGERMIERLIKQLKAVGINQIIIAVGYLKESFEFLSDKYGATIVYCSEYSSKNSLSTLYRVRGMLSNSYILPSDIYLQDNVFNEYEYQSWYGAIYTDQVTSKWCLKMQPNGLITDVTVGGKQSWVMIGPTYFTDVFSQKFVPLLEQRYNRPGTENEYWETVFINNKKKLTLYARKFEENEACEIECIEDLRAIDENYHYNANNQILDLIQTVFSVKENEIKDISVLKAGMTNKSFLFTLNDKRYVFRVPGEGTDKLISRKEEGDVYQAIESLNISERIVYFNVKTGYKISRFYEGSRNSSSEKRDEVTKAMALLKQLHQSQLQVNHRFDIEERIGFYLGLCHQYQAIRYLDFDEVHPMINEVLSYLNTLYRPLVLCHADSVESNFIILNNGEYKLIDWEYAGMADPIMDVAMYAIYAGYDDQQIDDLLTIYCHQAPTKLEQTVYYSYIALGGFLWSLWTDYKQALGKEFGTYGMSQYRYARNYSRKVLNRIK